MIRNYLPWLNGVIGALAALLLLVAFGIYIFRPSAIDVQEVFEKNYSLPKSAFQRTPEEYRAIGPPFLKLEFNPATMQLPDLRRHLIYYGKNDRPDADEKNPFINLGFAKEQEIGSVQMGKPLYLAYRDNKYTFNPENEETTLWVEVEKIGDKEVNLLVRMRDETGQIISKPKDHASLNLKMKRIPRWGDQSKWDLGGNRVDASLLARQKARWYGPDRFLEKHGGPEYKESAERERIDFGEGADRYSVYVKGGDALIWKDGQWVKVVPGLDTQSFPLLLVESIDNRLMNFELWDVEGKGQVKIRLLKSSEAWSPKTLFSTFKFLGARTRSQFVFEIGDERLLLSPQDWLIKTDEGWKKLSTIQEIDDYVDRKEVGVLFVLDGVRRIGGRQMLTGTLFNSTRTALQLVELPMQQGGGKFVATDEPKIEGSKEVGGVDKGSEENQDDEGDESDLGSYPNMENLQAPEGVDMEQLREKMKNYRGFGGPERGREIQGEPQTPP